MRNVLVAGGAGGVGEGIVRALLADTSVECVIVSSRDPAKLEALRRDAGDDVHRLVPIVGGLGNAKEAEALRARVVAAGPLDAAVASLGGWWEGGPVLDVDDATWRAVLDDLLWTHVRFARAFIPELERADGRYLAIGGGAALTPVPSSALVSIAAAAQAMFVRSLVAERGRDRAPRIEELVVDAAVKTRGRHHGPVGPNELTAAEVGAVVASLLRDGTPGNDPRVTQSGPLWLMRPDDRRAGLKASATPQEA